MWLLIYLGPVFLPATVIFVVAGNDEAARLGMIGWLFFTAIGVFVKPRTIPEAVMVYSNAALFVLGVGAALLGLI
jgi:hypothetical protein